MINSKKFIHPYKHYYDASPIDKTFVDRFNGILITSEEKANLLFDLILEQYKKNPKLVFAWDTETKGLDFDIPEFIVGFSIAVGNMRGYYFPINHVNKNMNLPRRVLDRLHELLLTVPNFAYNAPFDIMAMMAMGYKNCSNYKTMDVMCLTYLMDMNWSRDGVEPKLDENGNTIISKTRTYKPRFSKDPNAPVEHDIEYTFPGNGLKWCEKHYLGHIVPTFEETLGIKSPNITFADLDPDVGCKYACIDAAGTYELGVKLYPKLMEECPDIVNTDFKLARVLPKILSNKVHFNKEEMTEMYNDTFNQYRQLVREMFKLYGKPFNFGSPKEKSDFLKHLNIDTGSVGKDSNMITNKGAISSIKSEIKLADGTGIAEALQLIPSLRTQMKYMEKLKHDGFGRFKYNTCSMVTGRVSSGTGGTTDGYYVPLNYQNLTKPTPAFFKFEESDEPGSILGYKFTLLERDELEDRLAKGLPVVEGQSPVKNIRRAISIPNDEWLFISRDYAQEELVFAAAISGEPVWGEAIKNGVDLHENTARRMFPDQEYNKHLRKLCKACNFSLLYGAGPNVFSQTAKIDLELAEELHERFWTTMKVLKEFRERKLEECKRNHGVLKTVYGRPRRLWSLLSSGDNKLINDAEKAILSHLVQGGCADVMRMNLVEMLGEGGLTEQYPDDFQFIGMIHDETNVLIRKRKFYDIVFKHQQIMEKTVPGTDFVLKTSIEIGNSYGETFPFLLDKETNKFYPVSSK